MWSNLVMRSWRRQTDPNQTCAAGQSAQARQARVLVMLAYDQDAVAWRERHRQGEVLDETPYGYHRAEQFFDLRWAASTPEGRLTRTIRKKVSGRAGFDVIHVWRNRDLIRHADVVWTHTEREHLAVSLVQAWQWRQRTVPVIAQTVWLWDEWEQYGKLKRSLLGWLLRRQDIEIVASRINLALSKSAVPGRRVEIVPFGSAGLSTPTTNLHITGDPLITAIGNDRHRDWGLLAVVAARMPEVRFRVASSSSRARRVEWPVNVTVEPVRSREAMAELYRQSAVVAVVITENAHASGATTLIEASGAARPLVVTDVGGLGDYAPREVEKVRPGDEDDLERALRAALLGEVLPVAPGAVDRLGLTQRDYVNRYVLVTRWLLDRGEWDPAVTRFEPVDLFSSRPGPWPGHPPLGPLPSGGRDADGYTE